MEDLLTYLRSNRSLLNLTAIGRAIGVDPATMKLAVDGAKDYRGTPVKIARHREGMLRAVIDQLKGIKPE